jgi:hypothetical protein
MAFIQCKNKSTSILRDWWIHALICFLQDKNGRRLLKNCKRSQRPEPHTMVKCVKTRNGLNSDFEKISDYHTRTGHHTSFWALTSKEHDNHHLQRKFKVCNRIIPRRKGSEHTFACERHVG